MGRFKEIAIEQQEQNDPLVKYPMVEALVLDIQAEAHDYCADIPTTDEAVRDIRTYFDKLGPYEYAKAKGLLVNNSGEEFACQFMAFWNEYTHSNTY